MNLPYVFCDVFDVEEVLVVVFEVEFGSAEDVVAVEEVNSRWYELLSLWLEESCRCEAAAALAFVVAFGTLGGWLSVDFWRLTVEALPDSEVPGSSSPLSVLHL